jgi:hypothetical protein
MYGPQNLWPDENLKNIYVFRNRRIITKMLQRKASVFFERRPVTQNRSLVAHPLMSPAWTCVTPGRTASTTLAAFLPRPLGNPSVQAQES